MLEGIGMKNKTQFLAILSMLMTMLGMSFIGGSRGVLVPVFKSEFLVTDSNIGFMFLVSTFGYMIFTYVVGNILETIGNKKTLIIGTFIIMASLVVMIFSPNFIVFTFAYFLNGAGNAFLIFGVNFTTPLFAVAFQAALMNIIHGSYGLGSAFVQRLTGYLISMSIDWRVMLSGFLAFQFLILFLIIISKYPNIPKEVKVDPQGAPIINVSPLKNKIVYFYIFALGFGLIGEHGINNWFVNYAKEGFGIGENVGSTYLSLFFILFTIGRFAGGFLLEKIGYLKGVIIAQLLTAVIYLIGIQLGANGFLLIAMAGILQAIIYPTIVTTIPKVFKKNSAKTMATIIIGSSLLNNLSSLFLGVLNDTIGVISSFYMLPIQVVLSAIAAYLIFRTTKDIFVPEVSL